MKTKIFMKKVRELGFKIEECDLDIDVINGTSEYVCSVSKTFRFVLDTDWTAFEGMGESDREDLYKIAVEYASTPLEERVEEKKYQINIINDVVKYNSAGSYLNLKVEQERYIFSSSNETPEYKTQFTQKEINNFPDAVKEILPLCKQIEVTP